VAALAEAPFDLVVTDRAMPDLSGDTVARAAAALGIPVLLLTGFGDLMAATGVRVPGATRVLSKPATAAALREAIAAAAAAPDRGAAGTPRVAKRRPRGSVGLGSGLG
jgi:FixJ family two-component response regulator